MLRTDTTAHPSTEPDRADGPRRGLVAVVAALTAGIVAGSWWVSFVALTDLAARSGMGHHSAIVWAIVLDGTAAVALANTVALPEGRRGLAWATVWATAVVSVAANITHAVLITGDGMHAPEIRAAVAATPPVLLVISVHMLMNLLRTARTPRRAPVRTHRTPAHTPENAAAQQAAKAEMPEAVETESVHAVHAVSPQVDDDLDAGAREDVRTRHPESAAPLHARTPVGADEMRSEHLAGVGGVREDHREWLVRARAGVSAAEIARDADVHRTTVSRALTAHRDLLELDDAEFARALRVPVPA